MDPCLWFGVARDEARAINRNMRDGRLAERNGGEVLGHWLDTKSMGRGKASQGARCQPSCHITQGQYQGILDRGACGLAVMDRKEGCFALLRPQEAMDAVVLGPQVLFCLLRCTIFKIPVNCWFVI